MDNCRVIGNYGTIRNEWGLVITARQQSCGTVMFSVVSVFLSTGGERPMWQLTMMYWTSPYIEPHPLTLALLRTWDFTVEGHRQTCSNLFKLDLTVQPPPPMDMFKLIHYEACMIGKRVVCSLLECFLVSCIANTNAFSPHCLKISWCAQCDIGRWYITATLNLFSDHTNWIYSRTFRHYTKNK